MAPKSSKPKKPKKSVGSVEKRSAAPAPVLAAPPPKDKRTCSICGNSLDFKGTFTCGVCKKKRMGECCYTGHPCKQ